MKSQPRQALKFSVLYSIPLLIWLSAQLQYIDWNSHSLQQLFRQSLIALLMLQILSISLLLVNRINKTWAQDVQGIIHIVFFPLPFFSIIWLTGSASAEVILKSLFLTGLVGAISIFIRIGTCLVPAKLQALKIIQSLLTVMLAIVMWNFHELWLHWLNL